MKSKYIKIGLLILLLLSLFSCNNSKKEIRVIVDKYYSSLKKGDLDQMLNLFSFDIKLSYDNLYQQNPELKTFTSDTLKIVGSSFDYEIEKVKIKDNKAVVTIKETGLDKEMLDKKIKESLGNKKIVVVDCYLGINDRELLNVLIKKSTPAHVILSEDIFYDGKKLTEMMQVNLTEDRVRGVMYYGTIRDYVDEAKLAKIQKFVKNKEGISVNILFSKKSSENSDLLFVIIKNP